MSSSTGTDRQRPPPGRRRDKPQVVCDFCRQRKGRCDRQRPCQTCVDRGLECTYPVNSSAHTAGVAQHASSSRPRVNLQARLSQLESMVASMIGDSARISETSHATGLQGSTSTNQLSSVPASGDNDTPVDAYERSSKTSESGSIRVNASESRYVDSGHWASILDSIAELKDHLEAEEDVLTESATPASVPAPEDDMEMPLLYSVRPASKAQILDALPPKQVLDRYIAYYFNSLDLAAAAIHTGKFIREACQLYEKFWESPADVPVMWLGLLYSIMCMAVMSSDLAGMSEAEDPTALVDQYREKTAQCLILGRYANGGPYTWETLYQYVVIELSSRKDLTQTIGILHGLSMNLLLQMGYHRDSSHFPNLTPFEGEIRRRSWVKSMEGDLQMSLKTGIPRRIGSSFWDTKEPRNLHDSDFDEDTKELPPSKPETEVTAVLQLIGRSRMLVAVCAAVDLSTSVKPRAYSEVLAVDQQLRDAEQSLPPPLKMKPLLASVLDPPQLIMHRHYLNLMFRMGEMMLHRKYLNIDTEKDTFVYSREKCLDSCLLVLGLQQTLNEEAAVGGLLHSAGSKLLLLGNHTFLTACMTLCVMIHKGLHVPGNKHALARQEEIKNALKQSLGAWRKREPTSREARIAAQSIRLVLTKNGWMDESLLRTGQSPAQAETMGAGPFGGFLGSGLDNGEGLLTGLGLEWDGEGFQGFMGSFGGEMALDEDDFGHLP